MGILTHTRPNTAVVPTGRHIRNRDNHEIRQDYNRYQKRIHDLENRLRAEKAKTNFLFQRVQELEKQVDELELNTLAQRRRIELLQEKSLDQEVDQYVE